MDKNIRGFLKYISLERNYSENTSESYTNDLLQFESSLRKTFDTDTIIWQRVDKNIIRIFLNELTELKLSKRSIARKLAVLKSFFKYLTREEITSQNPTISIKLPKFEKKLPEYVTIEEIKKIVKLPQIRTFEGLRDLAILELFYGTGLRLSELIELKIENIQFEEDLLRVRGKGNKVRVIPLGSAAKRIIETYLEFRPQYALKYVENIFVLKSGKKMYPMAVQRIVSKYLDQVTHVKQKSPHIFRHTYATHLLNAGASIRVVKDLLGHESLSTTQVYTHLSIDYLQKIYKKAHPGASDK